MRSAWGRACSGPLSTRHRLLLGREGSSPPPSCPFLSIPVLLFALTPPLPLGPLVLSSSSIVWTPPPLPPLPLPSSLGSELDTLSRRRPGPPLGWARGQYLTKCWGLLSERGSPGGRGLVKAAALTEWPGLSSSSLPMENCRQTRTVDKPGPLGPCPNSAPNHCPARPRPRLLRAPLLSAPLPRPPPSFGGRPLPLLSVGTPRVVAPQALPQIPLPPPLPPPPHPPPPRLPSPPGWEGSPPRGQRKSSPSSSSPWFAGQRWGAVAAACGVEAGVLRAGGGCGGMCAGELRVQENQLRPPQQNGTPYHPRGTHLILAQGLKQGHPSPFSRAWLPPTPVSMSCHW